ncbi:5-(hydroxymethyl)furfural/furfural oxidase [Bosea sp. AK1]|uniref:GMC family oxidoreductase n=1 Tax=Bosea sp. AK1 TaxID=2587160 RepID=UPI00114F8E13|nr:GMC family oxidoreductase N-terminal domain-containing protein [Bosea sp. AK1]TQI65360.1 5-(hydroxymethyl)furfural/furfural oxidase [Bosea sp. AK1]
MNECDIVIVGGGAAGSVLAARLSENPHTRIVLLEAGADIVPGGEPADVTSLFPLSTFNEAYMWPKLHVHWLRADNSPAVHMAQAKVLGGGSTIMGMWAMRGMPSDYDEWEAAGATGWSWQHVLPYFRRLETDVDFGGMPLHGQSGPVPIRRMPYADWPPFAKAVAAVSARRGTAFVEDMNGDFGDGHCTLALSRYERSRASAGICYLDRETRARANLTIRTETVVRRLLVEGGRIAGVVLAGPDGTEGNLRSSHTVLAAGALATPVLLMRSGLGPGAMLGAAGVQIIVDLPGVGQNLQTHPIVLPLAWLNRAGRTTGQADRPPSSTFLRWSSGLEGCPPGDMSIYVRAFVTWHALGRRLAMLAPVLGRPLSRGSVTLRGRDPDAAPIIAFDLLSDERDLLRMMQGFRRAAAIYAAPELRAMCGPAFVLENAVQLSRYNRITPANRLLTAAAASLLDAAPGPGRKLLGTIADMRPLEDFVHDDAALADYLRSRIFGTYHVAGTCRMGAAGDPMAVTNTRGRVRGIADLSIADTSLMPVVPAGNTHIPAVMVAERIAEYIKAELGA